VLLSSFNVNGLRAVLKKQGLIDYVRTRSPDVICLNEIKIDQETYEKEGLVNTLLPDFHQFV